MRSETDLLALWLKNVTDPELANQLNELKAAEDAGDKEPVIDAFYQDLSFGTAGLRGVIGAGTNRMNIYTVGRATQGFANYLNATFENPSVAIGRDSRNKGDDFVRHAATVFAANGITVYVYPRIQPTPAVSFAVRDLKCSGGVCMTASHNPAPYNGYKAYGPDGCQITTQAAEAISAAISDVDLFTDVRTCDFDEAIDQGRIVWIGEDTLDRYLAAVEACSVATPDDMKEPLSVVYTPLNGTGMECVKRILDRVGISNIHVVKEQANPDGNFPTCPYPNPEAREALQKGLDLCAQLKPDLLIATDPDADRVGIAVAYQDDYVLLSGNEVGVLLLDYCARSVKECEGSAALAHKVAVTTIVSSVMVDAIAASYGFEVRRVLTGFKYIGEQIGRLEAHNAEDRFLFGYEESYGYLNGSHVRDKDAVDASMLICQMAQYWKRQGLSLYEAMEQLYLEHGYYLNKTLSFEYPGASGAQRMHAIMSELRAQAPQTIAGLSVETVIDYALGIDSLPAAEVIQLDIAGGNKLIVRPSGTEPKIKAYLFAKGSDRKRAEELLAQFEKEAKGLLAE